MKNINDLKDFETKCEYYKCECENLKSVCENWKIAYEFLENKYKHLESVCEYWKSECEKLNVAQNSYKALLDMVTEEEKVNTKMTKSLINSLLKTNTLVSGQKTYLMYDDITQKFKIGKSYDPYKTEKELYLCRGSIYMVAYCDYDIESVLHSMFSENRVKDEWFTLSTNQVHWIINYFGMKATNRSKLNEFYETSNLPF